MSALLRLLCRWLGHRTHLDPAWCVRYQCERCGVLVQGGLSRWRQ